jgi:L-amino acid N-acyltransferase YncA
MTDADYRAVPYERKYLDAYIGRDYENLTPEAREIIHQQALASVVIVVLQDEKPVLFIGFAQLHKGVSEFWLLTGYEIKLDSLFMLRFMKSYLEKCIADYGWHRVQASVSAEHQEHQRFVEFFGFKKEGLMLKYGPGGENMWLYARVQ